MEVANKLGKARVGAERVEAGVDLEPVKGTFAGFDGAVEPVEGLFAVAEGGVDAGDLGAEGVAAGDQPFELADNPESAAAATRPGIKIAPGGGEVPVAGGELFRSLELGLRLGVLPLLDIGAPEKVVGRGELRRQGQRF